ncbi:MBL fold metallo-hydrolase [Paracoccus luteus]|uniref:MBL fold metallo-hydrolase n=1 Tax=Paracoccus luteus TaxID=2508543 RepID=UPI00106F37D8|nr:MBL fold metallo-hydrolase [Paracoccus luteus]
MMTRRQGLRWLAAAGLAPALPALAQTAPTTAPAGGAPSAAGSGQTRLILLGTGGGPTPLPDRNQPASVLVVNDTPYIIDAGNGVARQLMLAGIGVQRVGRIFITHHHDDHNADLGTLMGLAWSNGRTEEVHAYGPPGTEGMIRAFVDYFRPSADLRRAFSGGADDPAALFMGHDIAGPGEVYKDDNIRVTCIENTHYPNGGVKDGVHYLSYAYRFETPDRAIVFSGDTAESDALVGLSRGVDVLVHEIVDPHRTAEQFRRKFAQQGRPAEAAEKLIEKVIAIHTTPEEAGRVAEAAGVGTLVLNHFVPGYDPAERTEDWTEGVSRHYRGRIVVGADLMEI